MGGRQPEIEDKDILQVFEKSEDPVLSSSEVAEVFAYSTTGIYKRLNKLEERELVDSKKIGQGRAWWITKEGESYLSGH